MSERDGDETDATLDMSGIAETMRGEKKTEVVFVLVVDELVREQVGSKTSASLGMSVKGADEVGTRRAKGASLGKAIRGEKKTEVALGLDNEETGAT